MNRKSVGLYLSHLDNDQSVCANMWQEIKAILTSSELSVPYSLKTHTNIRTKDLLRQPNWPMLKVYSNNHSVKIIIYSAIFEMTKSPRPERKIISTCLSVLQLYRGHPYKLFLTRCFTDVRKYFFCNRVVKIWNELPIVTPILNVLILLSADLH